jgi:uncharacterized metal-binding protein
MTAKPLPVLYACSCPAGAGLLANHVAVTLDREGIAEMAPIAAIGAGDPLALDRAHSRFPVIAIDGCPLACARKCLEKNGIKPSREYQLARLGVQKHDRQDFTPGEAQAVLAAIRADLR